MRVWVQIIGLLAMLVFGIFIGMDVAERNMQKMQGIEGAPRAIQITPQEGKIEISVFGQTIGSEEASAKAGSENPGKSTGREMREGTNYLAETGNQVGTMIRELLRELADRLFAWTRS